MVARIQQNFPGQDYTHAWSTLGRFQDNPMGMHWTGIVFGLGAVQAMGYWTTDFLVVQRVLSAKDIRSAKMAPIIGSFFKMAVPLIVILPGLLGLAVLFDEELLGVIGLSRAEVRPFADGEIKLMATFADVSSSGVAASDGSSAAWAGWNAVEAAEDATASA